MALAKGDWQGQDGGRGVCRGRRGPAEQLPGPPGARADGQIALAEKQYDDALAHLAQANQQDPQVVYLDRAGLPGEGRRGQGQGARGQGGQANVLPLASYAFVRAKARKMAA